MCSPQKEGPGPPTKAAQSHDQKEALAPNGRHLYCTRKNRGTKTRHKRGIVLAQERFEEIKRLAPYLWEVPRCSSEAGEPYHVNLKWGECSCPDRVPEGEECKHTVAARYVKARTATCDGCGERFRYSELVEVMEEHDSLTWFPGDLLCIAECAGNHGVL